MNKELEKRNPIRSQYLNKAPERIYKNSVIHNYICIFV